jgi:hypothetical protein
MKYTVAAYVSFDPKYNRIEKKKQLRHGLSAAVQIGTTLWVANDETLSLERLTLQEIDSEGNYHYHQHEHFLLYKFLQLPALSAGNSEKENSGEADIEGLFYHDGYLWLVGSHSIKRSKTNKDDAYEERLAKTAKLSVDGNRYLLARIPVVMEDGTYTLKKEVTENGEKRVAAQLVITNKGNQLTKKLKKDKHLKGFFAIPGKENGFDIEGIAVTGHTVFLGMRGPVLRGWATVLEVVLKKPSKKKSSELKVKRIRKHFLQLGGLGIRDLVIHGEDLLLLAGPTMDLDGPVTIFRWKNAVENQEQKFVFEEELEVVMHIPYGKGEDHAEGISIFSAKTSEPDSILVVYDSASESRFIGDNSVTADIFSLPQTKAIT